MKIGIDASRAFLKNRTGIEEYSYQTIKNLKDNLESHQVFLYIRKNQKIDFELPENWKVKIIKWPRFWTQIGLSLEMLFHKVDALFIPVHTVPIIHPKNTVVVVHGLEYEFCPEAYSFLERIYMRCTIKKSCQWASKIISVSENTKKDLIRLYEVSEDKITVVYEGYDCLKPITHNPKPETHSLKPKTQNLKPITQNSKPITQNLKPEIHNPSPFDSGYGLQVERDMGYELRATGYGKYLLFIGRIEVRKNISNIAKAFEIFKEKYGTDHKLVLAGRPGYGYEGIKLKVQSSKFNEDIVELGYIAEEEKWELLKNADAFVFATLYEGFGIPILEAQSVGCPVIASDNSSIPEVVSQYPLLPMGEGARRADEGASVSVLLVNPNDIENIQDAMGKLAIDEEFKKDLIKKGLENVKRFSWSKCAQEISLLLVR